MSLGPQRLAQGGPVTARATALRALIMLLLPGGTHEKLSMGWPTCEMCASSRYWKGCSVGNVPSPGASDSHVPSSQDRGSTAGFITGGSEGGRSAVSSCVERVPLQHNRHWAGP